MAKILIVDDEKNIVELVKLYLTAEGYQVESAVTGKEGLAKWAHEKPDLVILDLMLPDIDGYEICRQVRAKSMVPILMLTARKEDVDKIVGLEMGADDYMTKPFNPRELTARIKAILRRSADVKPHFDATIDIGTLHIDIARHEVISNGAPVPLRSREFALLVTLARNAGLVLSRDRLLEEVWGFDYYGETRTVDVHIAHLRDKIADSDVQIETIRGSGYKMITGGDSK